MKFGQVDNLDSVDFNYSEIPLKTKENLSSTKSDNKIHFFFGAIQFMTASHLDKFSDFHSILLGKRA